MTSDVPVWKTAEDALHSTAVQARKQPGPAMQVYLVPQGCRLFTMYSCPSQMLCLSGAQHLQQPASMLYLPCQEQ